MVNGELVTLRSLHQGGCKLTRQYSCIWATLYVVQTIPTWKFLHTPMAYLWTFIYGFYM